LLLLSGVLVACAPTDPVARAPVVPAGPDPRLIARAVESAAVQVKRCYRPPARLGGSARYISTRLRVRFGPDGQLVGLPELLSQGGVTDETRRDAERLFEAASLAVIRCAPLTLPPELYARGWDEFELTFSRRAIA